MAAFCDGNVLWTSQKDSLKNRVDTLINLGYDIIIVNYKVDELSGKKGRAKKGLPPVVFKTPEEVRLSEDVFSQFKVPGRKIEQLTRFTALIEDAAQTHKMQTSPELAKYDLRAVSPTSEKTFQQACSNLDIDIISLDFTQKLPFYMKRPPIGTAVERGVHFEIKYSPAIRDSDLRRNIISNAINLVDVCKGKNIIISSECESPLEIRSPHDVANLALLFGLTPSQAKDAVSTNYRKLLLKARSRKTAHCVLSLTKASDLPPEEKWKIRKNSASEEEDEEEDAEEGESVSQAKEESAEGKTEGGVQNATHSKKQKSEDNQKTESDISPQKRLQSSELNENNSQTVKSINLSPKKKRKVDNT